MDISHRAKGEKRLMRFFGRPDCPDCIGGDSLRMTGEMLILPPTQVVKPLAAF